MEETTKVYIDASYSPQHKVGVAGIYIPSHNILDIRDINGNGSTGCEMEGLATFKPLIESLSVEKSVVIYTDCNKIMKHPELWPYNSTAIKKGVVDPNFKIIDKATRKHLRRLVAILTFI